MKIGLGLESTVNRNEGTWPKIALMRQRILQKWSKKIFDKSHEMLALMEEIIHP